MGRFWVLVTMDLSKCIYICGRLLYQHYRAPLHGVSVVVLCHFQCNYPLEMSTKTLTPWSTAGLCIYKLGWTFIFHWYKTMYTACQSDWTWFMLILIQRGIRYDCTRRIFWASLGNWRHDPSQEVCLHPGSDGLTWEVTVADHFPREGHGHWSLPQWGQVT